MDKKWATILALVLGYVIVRFMQHLEWPMKSAADAVGATAEAVEDLIRIPVDVIDLFVAGWGMIVDVATGGGQIRVQWGWPPVVLTNSESVDLIEMWENNGQTASDYYYLWTTTSFWGSMSDVELTQHLRDSFGTLEWSKKEMLENYTAYEWASSQVALLWAYTQQTGV